MIEERLFEKANILINQGRYNEAEKVLGELLSVNPNNDYLLYLLSEVYLQQDNYDKAEELINSAIANNPDEARYQYTKSRIYLLKDNRSEAIEYIQRAIALNPNESIFFSFWAQIELLNKDFGNALDKANHALSIDSSDLLALNIRSTAQLKLGNKEESFNTIAEALHEDPNNAYTHANHGWGLLEKGEPKKALEHFTEALKNDPNNQYAQAGMREGLKARFMMYRWFLKYSFWMSNMTSKYQWLVIIGFYFGTKFLQKVAQKNEALAPFLYPIVILLFFAAFFTWIANPIGNLFLQLNPYGKYLLNKEEKIGAIATGTCLLVSVPSVISFLTIGNEGFLALTVFSFTMMIPTSNLFTSPNYVFIPYNIGMLIVGTLATIITFNTGTIINNIAVIYLLGLFAFQFIVNYFISRSS